MLRSLNRVFAMSFQLTAYSYELDRISDHQLFRR